MAFFPGMQGGPLEHVIASKAIAFGEALQDNFKTYGQQVIKNAQAMADAFVEKGYKIISGGTDNHLMLIDLRSKDLTGKIAEESLIKADITINKNMVPFDTEKPMITSGMRIGSAAITSRGFNEADCTEVVNWIDQVVTNHSNEGLINEVKVAVNNKMSAYPMYEKEDHSYA